MREKINQNCAAALNFDRFDFAEYVGGGIQALAVWALCQDKQKSIPHRIPLILTVKQRPDYRGFFTFIAIGLHGLSAQYTGWCMPITASLAALVKRLHNLTTPKRQNGLYADKLTRSANLALYQNLDTGGAGKPRAFVVSLPL